jgi:protein-S-isoprenylcysteine O-methyltransferase Ste14
MLIRILVQALLGAIGLAALLFLSAGTWDWPQGWGFLVLFSAGTIFMSLWMLRNDPALLAARMRSPLSGDQRPRDRAIVGLLYVVCVSWFVLIALDARRYGWSHVPAWAQTLGAILIVWSFWGWTAVLRANSFAASNVRVQEERGQTVISSGPYAIVRHPMYAYVLPFGVGASLMLGSLWGLLGLIPLIAILAARTLGEEAVLNAGLPGYSAYARKVRYRLLPGIW